MSQPLSYSTPTTAPPLKPAWRSYWLRIPIFCWLAPLIAGITIFTWMEIVRPPNFSLGSLMVHGGWQNVTPEKLRMQRFLDAGLLTLLLGSTLAFYGMISLIAFAMLRWPAAVNRWQQVVRPALFVLALLLSNFLVAGILSIIAFR